jgi:hypothetical protein
MVAWYWLIVAFVLGAFVGMAIISVVVVVGRSDQPHSQKGDLEKEAIDGPLSSHIESPSREDDAPPRQPIPKNPGRPVEE